MEIREEDFILTSVDDTSPFFDLEVLKTVNKGKPDEKKKFQNVAYGIPLESAIKRIAQYRIANKLDGDSIGLKAYLEVYKKTVEEIKALCNG